MSIEFEFNNHWNNFKCVNHIWVIEYKFYHASPLILSQFRAKLWHWTPLPSQEQCDGKWRVMLFCCVHCNHLISVDGAQEFNQAWCHWDHQSVWARSSPLASQDCSPAAHEGLGCNCIHGRSHASSPYQQLNPVLPALSPP